MDRTERFYLIDQLLNNNRVVTRAQFLEALEVSPATFKRDLEYLRDRLGAPIIWDHELRGYRYEQHPDTEHSYQLPGLWFNTSEIHALLTMNAWMENLQQEVLSEHIKPLQARIRALLDQGDHSVDEITRRIRIISQARQSAQPAFFQLISQALLNRKRLNIKHFNRQSGRSSARQISPQRLTFYRDNWYLDSWCHRRQAIRSFAVDALEQADLLAESALEIDDQQLDRELGSGYGIFSGTTLQWAELKFTPEKARWLADEQWHPHQKTRFDEAGYFYLSIPYSQAPELIMDILKHGSAVEVMSPPALRQEVKDMLIAMQQVYAKK